MKKESVKELKSIIKTLRTEITALKKQKTTPLKGPTVKVPAAIKPIFDKAQATVGDYFEKLKREPTKGSIDIDGERYILVRASALSLEFINSISHYYGDRGSEEAQQIGREMLFDIAHMLGIEDARNFHKKMGLKDPISKLSAGPVHFAYAGWAFVDILKESKPSPDENFFIKFNHPYSFEAASWVKAKKKSKDPVCIMNAGYSSGWCEASFGMSLTAVELTCKARGDKQCTFIMAPPHKIGEYLKKEKVIKKHTSLSVPTFLERKKAEEEIKSSLAEKDVLLREIHHRVKNNLQIISSLLNLQVENIHNESSREKFKESINRIKSMAIIHELLYRSKNLSTIRMRDYLEELTNYIRQSYNISGLIDLHLNVDVNKENINIDKAIPCGIIINELLSNAFKYAFPDKRKGKIEISFTGTGKMHYMIRVSDDGVGIKEEINLETPKTLGLQLVSALVGQLDGKVKMVSKKGTTFTIVFSAI
jgi:two-component sensor histidine kinase/predicted hydrocarbon binding protein